MPTRTRAMTFRVNFSLLGQFPSHVIALLLTRLITFQFYSPRLCNSQPFDLTVRRESRPVFLFTFYCQSNWLIEAPLARPALRRVATQNICPDPRNGKRADHFRQIIQFCAFVLPCEITSGILFSDKSFKLNVYLSRSPSLHHNISNKPLLFRLCSVFSNRWAFKLSKIISSCSSLLVYQAMRVNALTNAQKKFSQLLILRHFQEVNTH